MKVFNFMKRQREQSHIVFETLSIAFKLNCLMFFLSAFCMFQFFPVSRVPNSKGGMLAKYWLTA